MHLDLREASIYVARVTDNLVLEMILLRFVAVILLIPLLLSSA